MTKGERDKLVEISSTEINAVKRLIAALEESARLLSPRVMPSGPACGK